MLRQVAALLSCLALTAIAASSQAADAIKINHFSPEPIKFTVADMPEPYATESVRNNPKVVAVPDSPVLETPEGFEVTLFAELPNARWLAVSPEGDILCAIARDNKVYRLADRDGDGLAEVKEVFVDESQGAMMPFGMAFADGAFFLGNTNAVLRYSYEYADGKTVLGEPQKITTLPGEGYNQHWTRNVVVAPDGQKLYASVGSKTNASEEESPRASVLRMNLDGSEREVFASGLRNPTGLDFHPQSGELYVNVNERDEIGDGLVPDYFTRIQEGEFYGWPYAMLSPEKLDPRLMEDGKSLNPEQAAKTKSPDVLYEAHSAALGLTFYDGDKFPNRYRNGAYTATRGSWNRERGAGYKIVFVPFGDDNRPLGHYEDFVRGFLLDPSVPETWGRPVGIVCAPDGSLYFTEEANGRIYRVSYSEE